MLQSIFHLDICSFLTLPQLVCDNLALYHTQLLFVLYPLPLPLGQPVPACGERTVCALEYLQLLHLPGTISSVHSLNLGIHLKGWELYGIVSSLCILEYNESREEKKLMNLFSWFSHLLVIYN